MHQKECCQVGGVGDAEYHSVQPQEQHEDTGCVHARLSILRLSEVQSKGVCPTWVKSIPFTVIEESNFTVTRYVFVIPTIDKGENSKL